MTINLDKAQNIDYVGNRRLFDFGFKFREKDIAGTVENIAGWVYEMTIFNPANPLLPLLIITHANGISIVDNWVVILVPGASFTIPKGAYSHLIKRTKDGSIEPVQAGAFIIV